MKALVFENHLPKLIATGILSRFTPRAFIGPLAPMQMRDLPDPVLPADDWLVMKPHLCGLCGSDYKQVFMKGSFDNPMTGMISFPQVLGHEVVGTIERIGPDVRQRRVGERVVLNPWLSCVTRGLPPCEWCQRGELAQCLNFTRGHLTPGIHHGNSSDATGGFATLLPAHESQCIPVPDGISDEQAVLADPFSVSLHAILRHPPSEGATALVYGAGTLGLAAVVILRALYPSVRVLVVARFPHQRKLAEALGAERVLPHEPPRAVVEGVASALGTELHEPWRGLPMLNNGVDVVYDTVTSPGTLEIDVRITRARGKILCLGVEPPKRFEWTPLYFKEISLVGSNAFAIEDWQGRRQHAFEWYFEWLQEGRIDLTPIITHRYPFGDWRKAFMTCFDQGGSGAVKVLFNHAAGS